MSHKNGLCHICGRRGKMETVASALMNDRPITICPPDAEVPCPPKPKEELVMGAEGTD